MLLSVNDAFELLEDGQCPLKLPSIEIFPLWLLAAQAHFIEFWLAEVKSMDSEGVIPNICHFVKGCIKSD